MLLPPEMLRLLCTGDSPLTADSREQGRSYSCSPQEHIVGTHHSLGDLPGFTALVFVKCFSVCSESVVIFSTTVKQMVLYPEDLKPRRNGLAQHHGTSKWKGQVPTPGHLSLAWVFRDCLELFVEGSLSVCWSWKVSDFRARWDTLRISTKGFAL